MFESLSDTGKIECVDGESNFASSIHPLCFSLPEDPNTPNQPHEEPGESREFGLV